jgi:hypothetical protein
MMDGISAEAKYSMHSLTNDLILQCFICTNDPPLIARAARVSRRFKNVLCHPAPAPAPHVHV